MRCSGDRPWLGGRAANEPCDQKVELLVRTASHAYFGQMVSALRLPDPEPDPLTQRGQERNIEVGVLIEDASFASYLAGQWIGLIDAGFVAEYRGYVGAE